MLNIVFSKTGMADLTIFKARSFPVSEGRINVNQRRYLTEASNPKVVSFGNTSQIMQLRVSGLDRDNFDGTVNGVKTWFQNSLINWSENNFTMTDENGEAHTVRLWQDNFDMPEVEGDQYALNIRLLVE